MANFKHLIQLINTHAGLFFVWLKKRLILPKKTKLVVHFIVITLIMIILGKVWFSQDKSNTLLYLYGILVTSVLLMTFIVTFTLYRDPYYKAIKKLKLLGKLNKKPLVTWLVAVLNEEKIIGPCIQSLVNQTYVNQEIIVINDASTDGTRGILDKYAQEGQITVIHLDNNVGKKRALGKGVLRAKGRYFIFTDSDTVVARDAVEKMTAIFEANPEVGGISGHARALNANKNTLTKIQDAWYEGQYSIRKAFESVFGAVTCVSGPLAAFKREAIFNYIPAWENDTFLGQEFKFATDRTLTGFVLGNKTIGNKLKKKYSDSPFVKTVNYPLVDWKIVYCKSAKAWTLVPDTIKSMLKQQIRWKKSFIRNIFFTALFYWKKPIIPALVYYLHILFVLLGPLIVFRHLVYIPAQGNIISAILYLSGIVFVGFTFGLAYKLENKNCHRWIYRPGMSLLSTLVLSWLIFYSALTIKKMVWYRA